jgi:hypothetical protein
MAGRALVAVVQASPTTILDAIEHVLQLAELGPDAVWPTRLLIDQRRRRPFPAANTTPWQLDGALRALGLAASVMQNPRTWRTRFGPRDPYGYAAVMRSNTAVGLSLASRVPVPLDSTFPTLRQVVGEEVQMPQAMQNAQLLTLPTLKTDALVGLGGTLSVLASALLPDWQRVPPALLPSLLVDCLALQRTVSPQIGGLIDGTTAALGAGPYRLRPQVRNLLLASTDPIALDAVAARLLGRDPLRDVPYLRIAQERGLGVADLARIELVGDQAALATPAPLAERLRPGLAARLARTPFANLAFATESLWYERLLWALRDRDLFESWLLHSPWGRLFGEYQRNAYGRAPQPRPRANPTLKS